MHERLRATPIDFETRQPRALPLQTAVAAASPRVEARGYAAVGNPPTSDLGSIRLGEMSVEDHNFIKIAAAAGPDSRRELAAAADISLMELDAMVDQHGKFRTDAFSDEHAIALRRLCLVHRLWDSRAAVARDGKIKQTTRRGMIDFHQAVRTHFAAHRAAFGSEPVPARTANVDEHED